MRGPVRVIWVLFAIALSIGLLLGLLAVAGLAGSAVTWRSEVDRYLAYEAASGQGTWHVRQTVLALRPDLFTRSLAGEPRSDSLFPDMHGNDLSAGAEPSYPPFRPLATADKSPRPVNRFEELVFPPVQLWCVLLGGDASAGLQPQSWVIFVARHESLYSGSWVIYSGARSPWPPAFAAGLQQIGCDLKPAS